MGNDEGGENKCLTQPKHLLKCPSTSACIVSQLYPELHLRNQQNSRTHPAQQPFTAGAAATVANPFYAEGYHRNQQSSQMAPTYQQVSNTGLPGPQLIHNITIHLYPEQYQPNSQVLQSYPVHRSWFVLKGHRALQAANSEALQIHCLQNLCP